MVFDYSNQYIDILVSFKIIFRSNIYFSSILKNYLPLLYKYLEKYVLKTAVFKEDTIPNSKVSREREFSYL